MVGFAVIGGLGLLALAMGSRAKARTQGLYEPLPAAPPPAMPPPAFSAPWLATVPAAPGTTTVPAFLSYQPPQSPAETVPHDPTEGDASQVPKFVVPEYEHTTEDPRGWRPTGRSVYFDPIEQGPGQGMAPGAGLGSGAPKDVQGYFVLYGAPSAYWSDLNQWEWQNAPAGYPFPSPQLQRAAPGAYVEHVA